MHGKANTQQTPSHNIGHAGILHHGILFITATYSEVRSSVVVPDTGIVSSINDNIRNKE
jgi:hypothetical protein